MAVTLNISPAGLEPLTEILETARSIREINATITAIGDAGEIFESVTASLQENEPGVSIVSRVDSVTIQGKYIDPFSDTFKYVNKESSDKIESPTIVVGVANMPPKKELYELNQDTRENSTRTYNITVVSDLGTDVFVVTHKIYNEWEGIRSFIDTYYD